MAQPKGTRINGVMFISVLIVTVLILRLAFLQVIQGEHHAALARNNRERQVINPAPRGLIVDSSGAIIARNEIRYEVGIRFRPSEREEVNRTFDFLADEFFKWEDEPRDEDDNTISLRQRKRNTLDNHRRYQEPVILERGITKQQMLELEELSWEYPLMQVIQRPVRYYQEGALFPHLFQGMNSDGTPKSSSIELGWDDYLRPHDGHELWAVDVRSVPIELVTVEPPVPGNSVVLTLDLDFQKYVQEVLAEGIENNQQNQISRGRYSPGRHGAAVVLDVRTGDILAIASYPDFHVDELWTVDRVLENKLEEIDYTLDKHLNIPNSRLVKSNKDLFYPLIPYGPGSTIKVLTGIIALEEGVITPNQRFNDRGLYPVGGANPIRNANNRVWGSVNFKEALTVSLNSYFGWMVDNLTSSGATNRAIIRDYSEMFGVTGTTGFIDVPGYNGGRMFSGAIIDNRTPEGNTLPFDPLRFTIGAPSAIQTSPMHMANFISMVANKGYHYRPRLVKEVVDPDGNVVEEFAPELYRNIPHDVVSESTYDTVIDAMKSVTRYGTRFNGTSAAAFNSFPLEVAAKSGSADAGVKDAHSWWMGFAPANDPEIAVVVFTEHGGMNTHTHHIARKIMDEYFGFNEPKQEEVDDEIEAEENENQEAEEERNN